MTFVCEKAARKYLSVLPSALSSCVNSGNATHAQEDWRFPAVPAQPVSPNQPPAVTSDRNACAGRYVTFRQQGERARRRARPQTPGGTSSNINTQIGFTEDHLRAPMCNEHVVCTPALSSIHQSTLTAPRQINMNHPKNWNDGMRGAATAAYGGLQRPECRERPFWYQQPDYSSAASEPLLHLDSKQINGKFEKLTYEYLFTFVGSYYAN